MKPDLIDSLLQMNTKNQLIVGGVLSIMAVITLNYLFDLTFFYKIISYLACVISLIFICVYYFATRNK